MNTALESIHFFLRGSHIVMGFLGLALFWVVIAMKKGTATHRFCGYCFVVTALYVGSTALISASWALLHVDSFAPELARLSHDLQGPRREQYRFLFSILLFLASATIAGAIFGQQSMRHKENIAALRRTSLPFWQGLTVATALGLVLFGAYRLATGVPEGGLPWGVYWIPLLLGSFGVGETVREIRQMYQPLAEPREWLYRHIESMFGTGVAFHTAFLVFGSSRLFGYYLSGPAAMLPWITPLIVGGWATKWYLSRLRSLDARDTRREVDLTAQNAARSHHRKSPADTTERASTKTQADQATSTHP